jgi:hypothetical protein
MVLCDAKGFGGEEEVELLREPWWNGLLDRFEGLVLLGLGPPAIFWLCVQGVAAGVGRTKKVRSRRVDGYEARKSDDQPNASESGPNSVRLSKAGVKADAWRVKQLRNVVMPKS